MDEGNLDVRRVDRRRFLRRAAGRLGAVAAGTFLYTWRIEPHWVEVVHHSMPLAHLPPALAGKRIVQLSDLHAGPIVDEEFLRASLASVGELAPDAIVLTGDFMSCDGAEEIPRALAAIRALPPTPLGRFAVLGNHDFGVGWKQTAVADKLTAGLERLDVRVLRNETADLGGLQVAGVDDLWSPRYDAERMLGELPTDRPVVALCHNPDGVDRPEWREFRGWILSGHTHGGQCKPPFLPPPLVPVQNRRYVAGEYAVGEGRRLYINRGLGYLRRVRFNARPEITVFTLQQAPA